MPISQKDKEFMKQVAAANNQLEVIMMTEPKDDKKAE
jgi:hypothetical protein